MYTHVFICMCIPYTYTYLYSILQRRMLLLNKLLQCVKSATFSESSHLCKAVHRRDGVTAA